MDYLYAAYIVVSIAQTPFPFKIKCRFLRSSALHTIPFNISLHISLLNIRKTDKITIITEIHVDSPLYFFGKKS